MPVSPDSDPYYRLRHSAAHVMAQAVLELFPGGKIAIGPPIEDGFYYDFDLPRPLTPEDLSEIEQRMRRIIAGNFPFARRVVSAEEAQALFKDQPYKLELIAGLQAGQDEYGEAGDGSAVITTYKHDSFEDLCRGPHVEHTGEIPPDGLKLLSVSGAYWRGDEHRPMLQRIYGTTRLHQAWSVGTGATSPIIAGGVLFAATGLNGIVALDPRSGRQLWGSALPTAGGTIGSIHWESPIVIGGRLYCTDENGQLSAYGL